MTSFTQRQRLNHSPARTLAALIGTVPVALGVGVVLALALPLAPAWRVLLGSYSVFPVWATLALLVLLAHSGRRAWLGLLAALVVLAAAASLAQRPGRGCAPEPTAPSHAAAPQASALGGGP